MRTSTNFAHLTSFQAIDWSVPKTLDIFVCQTSENKAFKMQHSVTVVRPLFAAKNAGISCPVSTFSSRMPSTMTPSIMTTMTTREEMKVRVQRIYCEIRLKDDKQNTHP